MLDLQHRWVAALVKAEVRILDTILVDSYVDTDESGSRFDKAGVLAALKSGNSCQPPSAGANAPSRSFLLVGGKCFGRAAFIRRASRESMPKGLSPS
jgi:hypothetical protein